MKINFYFNCNTLLNDPTMGRYFNFLPTFCVRYENDSYFVDNKFETFECKTIDITCEVFFIHMSLTINWDLKN